MESEETINWLGTLVLVLLLALGILVGIKTESLSLGVITFGAGAWIYSLGLTRILLILLGLEFLFGCD